MLMKRNENRLYWYCMAACSELTSIKRCLEESNPWIWRSIFAFFITSSLGFISSISALYTWAWWENVEVKLTAGPVLWLLIGTLVPGFLAALHDNLQFDGDGSISNAIIISLISLLLFILGLPIFVIVYVQLYNLIGLVVTFIFAPIGEMALFHLPQLLSFFSGSDFELRLRFPTWPPTIEQLTNGIPKLPVAERIFVGFLCVIIIIVVLTICITCIACCMIHCIRICRRSKAFYVAATTSDDINIQSPV